MFFAGIRYGVATDYWSYYGIFSGNSIHAKRLEGGFRWLIWVYKFITNGASYNGFVFFIAFLSIGIKYVYFNTLQNPLWALFIYIGLFYINVEYNVVRQGLAIALVFLGVDSAVRKNFFGFLCFLLLAASIHISSFLLFPFYFLYSKKIKISFFFFILLFIAAVIVRLFVLDFILNRIAQIFTGSASVMLNHLRVYLSTAAKLTITNGFIRRFAIILAYFALKDENKNNCGFLLCYIISFFMYFFFMGNDLAAYRLSLCFDVFALPLFGNMNIRYTGKNIIICIALVILICITYFYQFRNGFALPYRTYL
jgi:hypothetical protein